MKTIIIKKLSLIIACFFISASFIFSQTPENCSNGIDDDGDGFVDCYDPDCMGNIACQDFYMQDNIDCEVKPTEFPNFNIQEVYKSAAKISSNHAVVVVGDIIGDKTPEVVVANTGLGNGKNTLSILSGKDLSTIKTTVVGDMEWQEYIAIAKIDNKDCGYIFLSTGPQIIVYNCNLEIVWETGKGTVPATYGNTGPLHLADFNRDGKPELYYKNEIRDALTGKLLVKGSGDWLNEIAAGSIAVDISSTHDGLELINGLTIYQVITGATWNLNVIKKHNDYFPYVSFNKTQNHNFTSVADYDLNGEMDIVVNGAVNSSNGDPTVFLWKNPMSTASQLKTFSFTTGTHSRKDHAPEGTGIVNIANIDDQVGLNCTFAVKTHVYALDGDFNFKWRIPITESSSGNTGTTIFDFNGDGKNEIVYRDENYLYIIQDEGGEGKVRTTFICGSQTGREYPVVADVNGDGETEIIASCFANDNFTIGKRSEYPINRSNGVVKMFASLDDRWVRARTVWNQHGYFNVNINDDLTVPRQQQNHTYSFSDTNCKGEVGKVRPLNTFLNQSPYLSSNGCPSYASPDITFDDSSVKIDYPTCPDTEFTLSFKLINQGDLAISNKKLNVSFYNGVPMDDDSNRLNIETVDIVYLGPDEETLIENLRVKGTGGNFTLYVKLNHPQTILECNPNNNTFSRNIHSLPFNIGITKVSDNNRCEYAEAGDYPDNGEARAFVPQGGTETIAGYVFKWFMKDENDDYHEVSPAPGHLYSGMPAGDYKVTAIHSEKLCASDTADITINMITFNTDNLIIVQDHPFTSCREPDGALKATIYINNELQEPSNYTYQWYKSENIGGTVISSIPVADRLMDKSYAVDVTNKTTGCKVTGGATVESEVEMPEITEIAMTPMQKNKCNNDPTGAIEIKKAITTKGTNLDVINHLDYRWYYNAEDTLGTAVPGAHIYKLEKLVSGKYGVIGILKSNGCPSPLEKVEVTNINRNPDINFQVIHNTSCDETSPNGTFTIIQSSGPTPQITIEKWNTSSNEWQTVVPTFTSWIIPQLNIDQGLYRFFSFHSAGLCMDTILSVKNSPAKLDANLINVAISPQTNCVDELSTNPLPNGSMSATYDLQTSGYQFNWYKNIGIKLAVDYAGHTINNIPASDYTLQVVEISTLCKADPVYPTVAHIPDIPVVTAMASPNTSCDENLPNGSITASASSNIDPPPSGYVFEFMDGAAFLTNINPYNQANGLAGEKTYGVRATNPTTLCASTIQQFVGTSTADIPVINAAGITTTPNSICEGTGNGSINATNAVTGDPADYEFQWYDNHGNPLAGTGPLLSNLRDGDYRLGVKKISSSCPSEGTVTITVGQNYSYPSVDLQVTQQQTICIGDPNGELTANATMPSGVGEPTSGYSFKWFKNNIEIATVSNPDQSVLSGQTEGAYKVHVKNLNTGCATESPTKPIINERVYPDANVVNVASTPNTHCLEPFNGKLEVQDAVAGYTYKWYDQAGINHIGDGTELGSIGAGTYQLKVVDDLTLCESPNNKLVQVANQPEPITVHIDILNHQTHCSNVISNHNGSLRANVAETGNFTYEWRGGQIAMGTVIGNDALITGLTAKYYNVNVKNTLTGCSNDVSELVRTQLQYPVVNAEPKPIETCDPYDGSITANVNNITDGHSFHWSFGGTGFYRDGLAPGEYTVYAVVDSTECPSPTLLVTVEDNISNNIDIYFFESEKEVISPPHCNEAGGQIKIGATNAQNDQFIFEWFYGSNTLPLGGPDGPSVYSLKNGLYSGNYNFKITNNTNKCIKDTTYYLPWIGESTLKIDDIWNAEFCKEPFNGTIFFSMELSDEAKAANVTIADFIYRLYEGTFQVGDDLYDGLVGVIDPIDSNVDLVFAGYPAGIYTLAVMERWSTYGCEERPMMEEIEIGIDLPKITGAAILSVDYSCDLNNPKGILTATAASPKNPSLDASGYDFMWYKNAIEAGNEINSGTVTGNTSTIEGLHGDSLYVVMATNRFTRCDTDTALVLPKNIRNMVIPIAQVATTPQDNCTEGNGTLLVQKVTEDGIDLGIAYNLSVSRLSDPGNIIATSLLNTKITALTADQYIITAQNPETKCESQLIHSIAVDTISPHIVNTLIFHDQFCAPINIGNGAIHVAIDETLQTGNATQTAGYSYEWFHANDLATSIHMDHELVGRPSGEYVVRITDIDGKYLNCVSSRSFTIMENNPNIAISKISTIDQTDCIGENGEVTVQELMVDGIVQAVPDGTYTIQLLETVPVDGHSFTRNAGTYQFKAKHNTFGCESGIAEAVIDFAPPTYRIEFATVKDFSCNDNGQGSLSAQIFQDNIQVPASQFTFNWFQGNLSNPISGNEAIILGLSDGQYHLKITDNTTAGLGCEHENFTHLHKEYKRILIANTQKTDQDICLPNGTAAIAAIKEFEQNGDIFSGGFTYSYYIKNSNGDILSFVLPVDGSVANPFNNLGAGKYTLFAENETTGCPSEPMDIHISDISTNPVVTLAVEEIQFRKSPPATPSGQILATIRETDNSIGTYNVVWLHGGIPVRNSTSVPGTDLLVEGHGGLYYVISTNQATNCQGRAEINLPEHIATPELNLASESSDICYGNGRISVSSVSIAGDLQVVSEYTFMLYKDFAVPGNKVGEITGTDNVVFTDLTAGLYYVVAIHNVDNLTTETTPIEVGDNSIYPLVVLAGIHHQTHWSTDLANHNGSLSIMVVKDGGVVIESNNGEYNVWWYLGEDQSGIPLPAFNNTFGVTGLTVGRYTAAVQDKGTGCITLVSYTIEDRRIPVWVRTDSNPNTMCVGANGTISASDVNPNTPANVEYDYYWYKTGNYPTDPYLYTGQSIEDVEKGTYTVYLIDKSDPDRYGVGSVTVEENLQLPTVTVTELMPQRNCDINKPTGSLLAQLTNLSHSEYEVTWFEHQNLQNPIRTDSWDIDQLAAKQYVVRVTHKTTGCSGDSKPFLVSEDLDIAPMPTNIILSHLTNCAFPNGEIKTSIDGTTFGYTFNWYFGSKVKTNVDKSGIWIDGIDRGNYTVTATKESSGCISDPVTSEILDNRIYPSLQVVVKNANCKESNGSAKVNVLNNASIEEVVWSDGFRLFYGASLENQPYGSFEVTVITTEKCSTSQEVVIEPDILVYNGISANGDGINDKFKIACIDRFFNNQVKIFNRSGKLVYEIQYYDNEVNYFEGYGNSGLYLGKKELPVGTYFYIIDLRNETPPRTGYLELTR